MSGSILRAIAIAWLALGMSVPALAGERVHGLALHGDLKYGPDFEHFDYADPEALKGGNVRLATIGTFDSLNPFILRGRAASGLRAVFDTLTVNAEDEPFSVYGLVAESIEVAPDNAWVIYRLRPEARFHDGKTMTASDVIFTFRTLRERGHPSYRSYYAMVEDAEALDEHTVRFNFKVADNPELPLIMGQLPVLPEHYWDEREFDRTTLEPPLGSGPYRIADVNPGRSITYERVEDYWGEDLPVRKGRYNFDRLRYDYYRDATVALEAFRAGEYDLRQENVARQWATGYDGSALREGRIVMEEIPHNQPQGMQGFAMNTRTPVFADREVRRAMALAFDYEWTNRVMFHDAYTRSNSYFSNSDLAAEGPPTAAERAILEPYREQLPPEVLSEAYQPPVTSGTGHPRKNLKKALDILTNAGWELRDGVLHHEETGQPLAFEILLVNPSFERVALPYVRNLKRIGVQARVRTVDTTQYIYRLDHRQFDMTVVVLPQSPSPGNEQRDYWHSESADVPGSRNIMGVRDPVVDDLVDQLVRARDRRELVNITRALDRVLLHGHYVVPNWHVREFRVAYWDKFGRPEVAPDYDLGFDAWWVDPEREQRLRESNGPRSVR